MCTELIRAVRLPVLTEVVGQYDSNILCGQMIEVPWAKWLSSTQMKRIVRICQWHTFGSTFQATLTPESREIWLEILDEFDGWGGWKYPHQPIIPFLKVSRHSCEFSVFLFSIFQFLSFYRGLFFSIYVACHYWYTQRKYFWLHQLRVNFFPKCLFLLWLN